MKSLFDTAKQKMIDEILRSGEEFNIPQSLQPQIMKSLHDRLQIKKKITKSDIKNTIKYIKYTADLQNYTKHFYDKNFYGFPLELMKGFNGFIDYVYENKIIPKFLKSKLLFRSFEFLNDDIFYNFTAITVVLHFYIILFKYKSKLYLMLYDTEGHHLHFALPISEDY